MSHPDFSSIFSIRLTSLAEVDYANIIKSMEESPKTTASYIDRFEGAVFASLNFIKEAPYLGKGLDNGNDSVRYHSIPDYNYAVYYEVTDEELEVLAFAFIPERAGGKTIKSILHTRRPH